VRLDRTNVIAAVQTELNRLTQIRPAVSLCQNAHFYLKLLFNLGCVAVVMADDPNDLRHRADRYQRLAQRMIDDDQAVQALEEMAREFKGRADEIEATKQKADRSS
jgi:hypothetical protein